MIGAGTAVKALLKGGKAVAKSGAIGKGRKVLHGLGNVAGGVFGGLAINDLLGVLGLPHLGSSHDEAAGSQQMMERILQAQADQDMRRSQRQEEGIGQLLNGLDQSNSRFGQIQAQHQMRSVGELDQLLAEHERTLGQLAQPSLPSRAEIIAAMGGSI